MTVLIVFAEIIPFTLVTGFTILNLSTEFTVFIGFFENLKNITYPLTHSVCDNLKTRGASASKKKAFSIFDYILKYN